MPPTKKRRSNLQQQHQNNEQTIDLTTDENDLIIRYELSNSSNSNSNNDNNDNDIIDVTKPKRCKNNKKTDTTNATVNDTIQANNNNNNYNTIDLSDTTTINYNDLPLSYQVLYNIFPYVYSIINLFSNNNKTVVYCMIEPSVNNLLKQHGINTTLSFDIIRQLTRIDSNLLSLKSIDLESYNLSQHDAFRQRSSKSTIEINELSQLYEIIQGKPTINKTTGYVNFYHRFKLTDKIMNDAKKQFMNSLITYYSIHKNDDNNDNNNDKNNNNNNSSIGLCDLPTVQVQNTMSSYGRLVDTCTVAVNNSSCDDNVKQVNKQANIIDIDNNVEDADSVNTMSGTEDNNDNNNGDNNGNINADSLNSTAYSNVSPMIKLDPELQKLIEAKNKTSSENIITRDEAEQILPPNLSGSFRQLLIHLLTQKWYRGQLTHIHTINAKKATTVPIEAYDQPIVHNQSSNNNINNSNNIPTIDKVQLHSRVVDVLNQQRIKTLYSHQAEAIYRVLHLQQSIVIATSTSSGKTYSYNIPVLQSLCFNSQTKAIYMFPTKALAQDQLRTLRILMNIFDSNIKVNTYDGDTPTSDRLRIKNECNVLLTNPDMLHLSMLPYHHDFKHIFSQLKYIIVDEMHIYRGAFGSHVAMVFRRLQRICRLYGSNPIFICCSATIANPRQLSQQLTGVKDVHVIDKDGSPHAAKHIVLWNCPKSEDNVDRTKHTKYNSSITIHKAKASDKYAYITSLTLQDEQRRKSTHVEASVLTSHLVQYNLKTICFAKVRKICELVTSLVHGYLSATSSTKQLIPLVKSYRGGYTLKDRRDTESKLFNGELRGVVSTNALELGIDVGGLDSTVHIGMPLSVSTLWQQAGRCGRGSKDSMSIVVAYDSPFDQYFMSNPDKLFIKPSEHALIDISQTMLLCKHLMCAAYELPIIPDQYTNQLFGRSFKQCINELIDKKCIRWHNQKYYLSDDWLSGFKYYNRSVFNTDNNKDADTITMKTIAPHNKFSLRTINNNNYQITDITNQNKPVVLDEFDDTKVFYDIFPQSIYLYHGKEYIVLNIDHDERKAYVKQIQGRLNYYTKCIDRTDVTVFDKRNLYDAENIQIQPLLLNTPSAELLAQTQLLKQIHSIHTQHKQNPITLFNHSKKPSAVPRIQNVQPGDNHLRTYDPPKRNIAVDDNYNNNTQIKQDNIIDTTAYTNALKQETKINNKLTIKPEQIDIKPTTNSNDIDVVYEIDTSELGPNFPSSLHFELPQSVTLKHLCMYGNVTVQTSVYGYRKIEKVSGRILEINDVTLPTMQLHTQAFFLQIPIAIKRALYSMNSMVAGHLLGRDNGNNNLQQNEFNIKLEKLTDDELNNTNEHKLLAELSHTGSNDITGNSTYDIGTDHIKKDEITHQIDKTALPLSYRAALHAIEHCMIGLVPIYILCDALHELGTECPSEYESKVATHSDGHDRILIFEEPSVAGLGIARRGCIVLPQLIDKAIQRIEQCECDTIQGCGGCVQGFCYQAGIVSDKRAALILLKCLKAIPLE